MANYAIVIVPQRSPFRIQFLNNITPPLLELNDSIAEFTYDIYSAVIVNNYNVSMYLRDNLSEIYPDLDLMIVEVRDNEMFRVEP
jgi:hypothetical protein|nr:MAG TPA: hypothetical protein [Caudoviricetes sp.]